MLVYSLNAPHWRAAYTRTHAVLECACEFSMRWQIESNCGEREDYYMNSIYIRLFQQLVETNKSGMRSNVTSSLAPIHWKSSQHENVLFSFLSQNFCGLSARIQISIYSFVWIDGASTPSLFRSANLIERFVSNDICLLTQLIFNNRHDTMNLYKFISRLKTWYVCRWAELEVIVQTHFIMSINRYVCCSNINNFDAIL